MGYTPAAEVRVIDGDTIRIGVETCAVHQWPARLPRAMKWAIWVVALLLASCGRSEPQITRNDAQFDEKLKRLTEPITSEAEVDRRLVGTIQVLDGLLLVRDPFMGSLQSFVLPLNTPWVVQCGFGLSVVFGSAVSGEGASNDVEIRLYSGVVSQEECARLGPATGKRIQALIGGTTLIGAQQLDAERVR